MQRTQSVTTTGVPIPFKPVGTVQKPPVPIPTMAQQMMGRKTVAQPIVQAGPATIQVARPTIPGVPQGAVATAPAPARSPGITTFRPPAQAAAATGRRFPILTPSSGSESEDYEDRDIFGNTPDSDYYEDDDEDEEPYDTEPIANVPRVVQPPPTGFVPLATVNIPRPTVAVPPVPIRNPSPPRAPAAQPTVLVNNVPAVPTVDMLATGRAPARSPVPIASPTVAVAPSPAVAPRPTVAVAPSPAVAARPAVAVAPSPAVAARPTVPVAPAVAARPTVPVAPAVAPRPAVPVAPVVAPRPGVVAAPSPIVRPVTGAGGVASPAPVAPGPVVRPVVGPGPVVPPMRIPSPVKVPVAPVRVPSPVKVPVTPVRVSSPVKVPVAPVRVPSPAKVPSPVKVPVAPAKVPSPVKVPITPVRVPSPAKVPSPVKVPVAPVRVPSPAKVPSPVKVPIIASPTKVLVPAPIVPLAERQPSPPRVVNSPGKAVIVPTIVSKNNEDDIFEGLPEIPPLITYTESPVRTIRPQSPKLPKITENVTVPAIPVLVPASPTRVTRVIPNQTEPGIPMTAPTIVPMPTLVPVTANQPRTPTRIIPAPKSPIKMTAPTLAPMPELVPVTTDQPRIPVRITPATRSPNKMTTPTIAPMPTLVPVTPDSPRMLPRSPQRNPIEGTPLGTPIIANGPLELVPRPRLVPVTQQQQVTPAPTQTIPIIPSPLRTTNVQPQITVTTGPPVPQSPTRFGPRTPTIVRSPVDTYPLTEQTLLTELPDANENQTDNRQLFPKALSDKLVQGGLNQIDINHVDDHKDHGHEDCCICLEKRVSPDKKIICGHAICADCTKQLRKAECPICRANIEGGYLTHDVKQAIDAVAVRDARVQLLLDNIIANCVENYPDESPDFCYRYREEFANFIADNPTITEYDANRIFTAFINFVKREEQLGKTFAPGQADKEFRLIGLQMLDNPTVDFDMLYDNFFQIMH